MTDDQFEVLIYPPKHIDSPGWMYSVTLGDEVRRGWRETLWGAKWGARREIRRWRRNLANPKTSIGWTEAV